MQDARGTSRYNLDHVVVEKENIAGDEEDKNNGGYLTSPTWTSSGAVLQVCDTHGVLRRHMVGDNDEAQQTPLPKVISSPNIG